VWGEAVRRRAPLILNDYTAAHEGKKGLPEGHVPLTRILVVPFFSRGKITAVAAVANRSTDYSQEDVVQMTSFLNSIEAATVRGRAEEALRLRNT
jgi:GAF domain-containing protein